MGCGSCIQCRKVLQSAKYIVEKVGAAASIVVMDVPSSGSVCELFGSVFGIYGGKYTGKIFLDGKEIHPSKPYEAMEYGLAYLPPNRKENSIIADMSVCDNGTAATLDNMKHGIFHDFKKQRKLFSGQVNDLHIKSNDINDLTLFFPAVISRRSYLQSGFSPIPRC